MGTRHLQYTSVLVELVEVPANVCHDIVIRHLLPIIHFNNSEVFRRQFCSPDLFGATIFILECLVVLARFCRIVGRVPISIFMFRLAFRIKCPVVICPSQSVQCRVIPKTLLNCVRPLRPVLLPGRDLKQSAARASTVPVDERALLQKKLYLGPGLYLRSGRGC